MWIPVCCEFQVTEALCAGKREKEIAKLQKQTTQSGKLRFGNCCVVVGLGIWGTECSARPKHECCCFLDMRNVCILGANPSLEISRDLKLMPLKIEQRSNRSCSASLSCASFFRTLLGRRFLS